MRVALECARYLRRLLSYARSLDGRRRREWFDTLSLLSALGLP